MESFAGQLRALQLREAFMQFGLLGSASGIV